MNQYSESLYWLEDEFETKEEAEILANNYVIEKYEGLHKRTLDALEQQAKASERQIIYNQTLLNPYWKFTRSD